MTVVGVCLTGVQPGVRARQVPPSARVGGWAAGLPGSDPPTPPEDTLEDELQQLELGQEDPFLQQKLQKCEEENVAGNYFKPKKRANELLVRFQDDTNGINNGKTSTSKKASTTNNLFNTSLSQSMWASNNNLNLSSSFNNSTGSYNSSWGSNSSSSSLNGGGNGGGGGSGGIGGGNGSTGGGGVMSNGWLGNGFASISPEMSLRRPNRLEALPNIDRKSRKKSKDVLHTLDLI
ncbi:hypothetical protein Pmani_019919 [Petrolisthes manimaculis]|uniref:Uncharacterized protein n=1 Tax=Petrolisthes manimaculis TaxID=1843537 RepID=A0AAE1U3I6_9EUCA|nr:hypothetical protein Pmani_019919 [Petrolisthes manimaculis]